MVKVLAEYTGMVVFPALYQVENLVVVEKEKEVYMV